MKHLFFVLLVCSVFASAQSPISDYSPPALSNTINDLQSHLEDLYSCRSRPCSVQETKALSSYEAKINQIAKALSISDGQLSLGCSKSTQSGVRLDGVHEDAFLRIQCGWNLNLIVLTKQSGEWEFLQNLIIPNKYEDAVVSVLPVTDDSSEQILIHKAQVQSGTGLNQQNFLVYKLLQGRLTPVLNVVERGWLTKPWTQNEVFQESKFKFEKATNGADPNLNTAPTFDETQILEVSGIKIQLKREHSWNHDQNQFIASQWYSGMRVPNAARKKPKIGVSNPAS